MNFYLLGSTNSLPVKPTRDQACGIKISAAGLTASLNRFKSINNPTGTVPWWDDGLVCLSNSADRQTVYNVKRQAGDKNCIVEFYRDNRNIYDEPGQPYQIPSVINETTSSDYLQLVEEVILNGFIPLIVPDGDEGDDPTYGYPNALRQLPILVDLLSSSKYGNLNEYVVYGRLWDGVFYGSSPSNIANFGSVFRNLLPNGYLAIEHNSGHIPVGNGVADWAGGMMSTYDIIMSEFDYSPSIPPNDTIWQIAARLLGPKYVRPSDQPANDDPNPPWYLNSGSPRGIYYPIAFEWDNIYLWVRSQITLDQINQERQYFRNIGYTYVS